MNYDNIRHKIKTIWDNTNNVENDTIIENIKIDSINNIVNLPFQSNSKKIYRIDSDWQASEVSVQNIISLNSVGVIVDQYKYYQYYYKDFEVILNNFPLRFIPYIKYQLIYKHLDLNIEDIDLRIDKIGYIYQVYDLQDSEDIWTVSKTVALRAGIVLRNYGITTEVYDVKVKLLVEVSNQKFIK